MKKQEKKLLFGSINYKIMLFGCFDFSDPRKGAHLLKEIISNVSMQTKNKSVTLITYGSLNKFNFESVNFDWKHFGNISLHQRQVQLLQFR